MFTAGEWIVLEQCLTEVSVNSEPFPAAAYRLASWSRPSSMLTLEQYTMLWEEWSIEKRVIIAAICLHSIDRSRPALTIMRAYEKLCRSSGSEHLALLSR